MDALDKIYINTEPKDVTINFEGVEIKLKIRELTWTERTQILTNSFKYDESGMSFDFNKYMKESLMKIIVQAPWGETNNMFFTRINSNFGSVLEKLVPKAFAEGQSSTNFFGPEQKT